MLEERLKILMNRIKDDIVGAEEYLKNGELYETDHYYDGYIRSHNEILDALSIILGLEDIIDGCETLCPND